MAFKSIQSPAKANEAPRLLVAATPNNVPMEWTTRHDIMLCREALVVNPFQARKKTSQRAQLWQKITDSLKQISYPKFKPTLTKRSVQDRCTLLCEKHKKRIQFEKRATGISPEVSELDQLVEELLEKEEFSEEIRKDEENGEKKKLDEDRQTAIDVRNKAMEKLSETKKRNITQPEKKKSRKSGSDTIQFLREQSEVQMRMREKEFELKKEQDEKEKTRQDSFMQMFAQQQQQQQQTQQLQMMMTQQNSLMLAMIEKIASKQ